MDIIIYGSVCPSVIIPLEFLENQSEYTHF